MGAPGRAILRRALTGEHHFDLAKLTEPAARALVAAGPPVPPAPTLSPRLAGVVARALAPRKEDRYASAEEMLAALA